MQNYSVNDFPRSYTLRPSLSFQLHVSNKVISLGNNNTNKIALRHIVTPLTHGKMYVTKI